MAIASVAVAGIVTGHHVALRQSLWSASSGAAQSLALQRLEQVRSAKWDSRAAVPVDELVTTNFPPQMLRLAVPLGSSNVSFATNYTTIATVSEEPPLKLVRVDCAWSFAGKAFTNTVFTCRAPDQ